MQRTEPARIYRVAELSRRVRLEVESWGDVWVEGELSDFARAKMENGERVRVLGALSLFEPSAMLQSLAAGDEGAELARRMRPRTRGSCVERVVAHSADPCASRSR